ncbi:MAG: purine-nucleoside phosphorylase [Bacilli bacterium]|nr:purine-nucleoside phosphorylase [Erysipelotrichaceae bacterium]MDY4819789.1 purine-nucleoside phosphorylase [Bacilli bacterium]MDY5668908.1 purine-nucleoside phosphorylase [Bacilli bacterium]
MPTPHNEALKGDIAKVVLMPGDPNRAKWIVDNFLHDVKLVNQVRGMVCYTGLTKNNKRISVMSSGMGHPSIGIYSHELYTEYDVDVIIRVGTCGSYQPNINLKDVLVCQGACTDSNWMSQYGLNGTFSAIASYDVLEEAVSVLKKHNYPYHVGNIFAADVFYDVDKDLWKRWARLGVMGVEMESYALYVNAAYLGKKALTLLTVTDNFVKEGRLTAQERQTGLFNMIDIAVETAEKFA